MTTTFGRSSAEALAATKPDAVSINSYPDTHAQYALKAMDAGCHVFMEKPIATTIEDAEAVVALHDADAGGDGEDDYYAQFEVPDDLQW